MTFLIRQAEPVEFDAVGRLMVAVYAQLEGFPKPDEQPAYYTLLAHVGSLTVKPQTELLVAASFDEQIAGAVVYFGDMAQYGSGGSATLETNSAGFRLLAVDPEFRGQGVGKLLVQECIRKARDSNRKQLIIHTTMAMQTAWRMYEQLGFIRAKDLDFMQGPLQVYGFRLIF